MWDVVSPRNLIDAQRKAAFESMGEQARALLADGYPVEADVVLDEMAARRDAWRRERDEAA